MHQGQFYFIEKKWDIVHRNLPTKPITDGYLEKAQPTLTNWTTRNHPQPEAKKG